MRNALYAKYGYRFKSKDLADFFSRYVWYTPNEDFNEALMDQGDKEFAELIRAVERE